MEDLHTQLCEEAISGQLPSNSHIKLEDNSDNADDDDAGSKNDTKVQKWTLTPFTHLMKPLESHMTCSIIYTIPVTHDSILYLNILYYVKQ